MIVFLGTHMKPTNALPTCSPSFSTCTAMPWHAEQASRLAALAAGSHDLKPPSKRVTTVAAMLLLATCILARWTQCPVALTCFFQAQAQAVAQQAADDLDSTETVDGRQGSLSSRRPKTPRCEGGQSPVPSPNARSRKMRKSARDNHTDHGR